jgi:AraC family transcriptional regulator of adaptative response / DNA-3-methyladenine glycosylase II
MRLAVRTPFAGRRLWAFLAYHLVPGVETAGPGWYARTLDLPRGAGTVRLDLPEVAATAETAFVTATFALRDLRDTAAAVERARRLLDADCDPVAVADHFTGDPVIGPLARRVPGLRVPGQVDGNEVAVRTVIGQQVSVVGARTVTGRLVLEHGRPTQTTIPGLTHLFPDAATLAEVDPVRLPMPRARGRALVGLCAALADGAIALDRGPDVFLPTDIGVRNALARLGHDTAVAHASEGWRPWRSYALMHLWNTLMPEPTEENRPCGP